jgi:hypothetical protein
MKSDQVLDRYNYCGPASKCIVSLQARPVTMLHQMTMSRGNFTNTRHATTYDHVSPLKLDLAGKHVLITGTAFEDGVGCATAMAFARAGATAIAIADLRVQRGCLKNQSSCSTSWTHCAQSRVPQSRHRTTRRHQSNFVRMSEQAPSDGMRYRSK